MPLSDISLRAALAHRWIEIDPYPLEKDIQPCSIDLHLGGELLVPPSTGNIDLRTAYQDGIDHMYIRAEAHGYELAPGAFVLGATCERVTLGNQYCAHFDGRSTLGRLGLIVHVTAGFCDPGFSGHITLEIKNVAPYSITLASGMGIGQLLVDRVDGAVQKPYGSKSLNNKYVTGNDGPVAPNLRRRL